MTHIPYNAEGYMKKYFFYNINNMPFTIAASGGFITDISLGKNGIGGVNEKDELLDWAARELEEYFAGERKEFSFPIMLQGTDFQKSVWEETAKVEYSKTVTYKDIAEKLGNANLARAVGNALNKNPVLIAIPCHRVLSVERNKFGFACGPDMKKYLLSIEGSEFLSCKQ